MTTLCVLSSQPRLPDLPEQLCSNPPVLWQISLKIKLTKPSNPLRGDILPTSLLPLPVAGHHVHHALLHVFWGHLLAKNMLRMMRIVSIMMSQSLLPEGRAPPPSPPVCISNYLNKAEIS